MAGIKEQHNRSEMSNWPRPETSKLLKTLGESLAIGNVVRS